MVGCSSSSEEYTPNQSVDVLYNSSDEAINEDAYIPVGARTLLSETQQSHTNRIEFLESVVMGQETFYDVIVFHRGGSVAQLASNLPPWAEDFTTDGNAIMLYSEHVLNGDFDILRGTIGRVSRQVNFQSSTGFFRHDAGSAVVQFIGDGYLLKELVLAEIADSANERIIDEPEITVTQDFEIDVTSVNELNIIVYIRQLNMSWGNIVRMEVGISGMLW